jgi:hypothetical protein
LAGGQDGLIVLVAFTFVSLFLNIYVFWIEVIVVVALYSLSEGGLKPPAKPDPLHRDLTYHGGFGGEKSLLSFPLPWRWSG